MLTRSPLLHISASDTTTITPTAATAPLVYLCVVSVLCLPSSSRYTPTVPLRLSVYATRPPSPRQPVRRAFNPVRTISHKPSVVKVPLHAGMAHGLAETFPALPSPFR